MFRAIQQNIFILTVKFVLLEIIGDIVYWPVWWYTKGLMQAVRFVFEHIRFEQEKIALVIWMRNIFTPMFGQYDWQGRIISFFMRCILIVAKMVYLAVFSVLHLVFFAAYIAAPVVAVYQIGQFFYQRIV